MSGPRKVTRYLVHWHLAWAGLVVGLVPVVAAADGAGRPVVWKIDNLERIGGHAVSRIGEPRIVDAPGGKAISFDGVDDALLVPVNPLAGLKQFTAEVVFRPDSAGPPEQRFFHLQETGTENRLLFETRLVPERQWFLDTFLKSAEGNYTLFAERHRHATDRWYAAAVTMDGQTMRHFVDGVEELSAPAMLTPLGPGQTSIGVRMNRVHWFRGAIREFRVTPRVLPPGEFLRP